MRSAPWLLVLILAHSGIGAQTRRSGKYQVTLRTPADGLFASEEMEIEIRLEDTSRTDPLTGFTPVIRAAVEARIGMPSMPSMPEYRESAHPEPSPGDYGVHPTFAHGGDYLLRLAIQPPRDEPFKVEFPLRVLDSAAGERRKPKPARYSLEIASTPKRPRAGEPAELRLTFRDRENPKAVFADFETVHEALVHLVILRRDLDRFSHEHPEPGPGGVFRLRYVFPCGGEYRLFADAAPRRAGSQLLKAKIAVGGAACPDFGIHSAWTGERFAPREAGGVFIRLATPAGALPVRKTSPVAVEISRDGRLVEDLEPYLGAAGHFLAVHEDAETFVHSHTDGSETAGRGSLRFLARFPKGGLYRAWVQVKRDGKVLTTDFLLRAMEAE